MALATDWTGPPAMSGRRLASWTSCRSVPDSRKTTIQSSVYRDVVVKLTESTRAFDVLTYGMWNCTYRRVLNKQDSRLSATIVAWKSNKYNEFSGCICSFRYPACNAHVPYCRLWPARLYEIFPHCHKRHDFRKKIIEHKMCFDFLYNFCLEHFSF
jgi:hypothetical protein